MNIAFVVPGFPVLSETFILNQITGLIRRGHNVQIFATIQSSHAAVHADVMTYDLMSKTNYLKGPKNYVWRALGAAWLFCRYFWRGPTVILRSLNVVRFGRDAASLNLLYAAIVFLKQKNLSYDIIHCQFGTLGPFALHLKQIGATAGKLVTSFRGYDATKYLQAKPRAYDQLFQDGDLFLPVSSVLGSYLVKTGCDPKRIVVHHSGVDCARFSSAIKPWRKGELLKIITVARLVEKKGVAYSIQAVGKLIASGYPISYCVIGDGPLREQLQNLISQLHIAKHVQLLGWKPQDEVIDLLRQAHLLIAPSITALDGDQEGIPNSVKEAMAMAIPVIATRHGGIPELVEDGVSGFLVPERDVAAIADRIIYLIDHPHRWREMGHAGRACVESKFNIEKLNEELVELYRVLLQPT